MLKILLKKQLLELETPFVVNRKTGERKTKKQMIGSLLLVVYIFGMLVFNGINNARNLFTQFCGTENEWIYFSLMFSLSTSLGMVISIIITYTGVFMAKDNDLLLSMPIPVETIVISRLFNSFIWALIFSIPGLIPAFAIYIINRGFSHRILAGALLSIILAPLVAVNVAAFIGLIIGLITKKMVKKNGILATLTILFTVIYSFLNSFIMGTLSKMTQEQAASKFGPSLSSLKLFGNALTGNILSILILLFSCAVVTGILYVLFRRNFTSIVTTKAAAKKKNYSEKMIVTSSQSSALLKREFKHFFGSAVYLINTSMGSFFTIIAAIAVVILGKKLVPVVEQLGAGAFNLNMIACAALIGTSVGNVVSTPSYTLEGKSFWILKSMPVDREALLSSKVSLHLIVTAVPSIFLYLSARLYFNIDPRLLVATILYIYSCGAIGLMLDLKWGSTKFLNETAAIKQNFLIIVAMAINLVLGSVSVLPYFLLKNKIQFEQQSYISFIMIFYVVLAVLMKRLIKTKGVELLEQAE